MQNNAMFICLTIGHALLKFRLTASGDSYIAISWRAVRFDQDVELVLTGKLIVEISLGYQLQQGGHLQQPYMVRPDYLRRDS